MNQLDIYPERRLIVAVYRGEVTMNEVTQVTGRMLAHPDFNKEFDGVTDYRKAEVTFTAEEMAQFSKAAVEEDMAHGVWCMLVSKPQETAMLSLFKKHLQAQHPVELFCTVQGVSNLLGQDLSDLLEVMI